METARLNLERTKPLTAKNALSQKDLDDATGAYQSAAAAVDMAKAQLETAQLNLSYCTITSPVNGITGAAQQQDGTYLSQANSLLTTVAVLTPMWVNFSLSENELKSYRDQIAKGQIRPPKDHELRDRDRPGGWLDLPADRTDHLFRSILQRADRHLPDPGQRQQPQRRASSQPVCACPH